MTISFADASQADINNKADTTLTVGDTTFKVVASDDGITIKDSTGATSYVKLSMTQQSNTTKGAGSSGSVTYNLQIDESKYSASDAPSVEVVEDSSNVSTANSNNAATTNLTYADNITLQVGARTKDSVNFTMNYTSTGIGDLKDDLNCTADGLGTSKLSLATQEDANAAIDAIGNAINKVSMVRGTFGAIQNRLEHKIDNLNTTSENLTDAESRIRDTDMATEMMNFTKNQILAQASQSMLAQANQLPQGVLSLLQ
jgi:flagellin